MPFFERGATRIHYQDTGSGFPLLVIYGGGLNSTAVYPAGAIDVAAEFGREYRCISLDLRTSNEGQSSGPLDIDNPWDMLTADQLGLLDHLGVDKFLVIGFCIGNPMIWNILRRAPGRVIAAVSAQPSGVDPKIPDHFYQRNLEKWAPEFCRRHPETTMDAAEKFLNRMYRNVDFVITASRDFVRSCPTPLLVLPDNTEPHPYVTAMEMVRLAPNAQVSLFPWKDLKENVALAVRHIRTFLKANAPAG